MRLAAILLAFLTLGAEAYGQAKAVISAPETAIPGDLVVLDGTESVGDSMKWKLVNSDKTFLPNTDGKKCAFASGQPGLYIFVLSVADCAGEGEPATVDVAVHKLQIGETPPNPPNPPGPNPGPDPEPDPDPDLTDLGKKVYELAKVVGNPAESKEIAGNYAEAAGAIAAGAYNSLNLRDAKVKIISDIYESNHPISEKNPKWNPFFTELGKLVAKKDQDGELDNLSAIRGVFVEIQEGLEAVQ